MKDRFIVLACALIVVLLASLPVAGQAPSAAVRNWTAPRTPDGQPDLQGIWSNATITPLERPADLAGKAFLTAEEAAAFEKRAADGRVEADRPVPGVVGSYNQFWFDAGTEVVSTRQTSLIVDPPDGRLPALTPEAQKKADARAEARRLRPADGPESRSLAERCILWGTAGPPMLPSAYNNNFQILQTPGHVMILNEMIHDARIIPLDGRPHLPQNIRQWMGDSRGRWEGNTLVIETTNFSEKTAFRGSSEKLHLVERFTRSSQDTLLYEFTVNDPSSFARPWTVSIPARKADGLIYEYACHEGNIGMVGILGGGRADDKAAEEAAKKRSN